jgi:hypothetical protein
VFDRTNMRSFDLRSTGTDSARPGCHRRSSPIGG